MRSSYSDTASAIIQLKSHRDQQVKRMVITLIPTLAAYDRHAFREHLLHNAVAYLISILDNTAERSFGNLIFSTIRK
jgi:serine/threonine-protein kinase mTOR